MCTIIIGYGNLNAIIEVCLQCTIIIKLYCSMMMVSCMHLLSTLCSAYSYIRVFRWNFLTKVTIIIIRSHLQWNITKMDTWWGHAPRPSRLHTVQYLFSSRQHSSIGLTDSSFTALIILNTHFESMTLTYVNFTLERLYHPFCILLDQYQQTTRKNYQPIMYGHASIWQVYNVNIILVLQVR